MPESLVLAALKRYQLIYDQVSDPNVSCHIQSSLMSSATEARVMMVILPQLAAFVAGIAALVGALLNLSAL